jgi:membrane protein DedA with SNARE-associated domain
VEHLIQSAGAGAYVVLFFIALLEAVCIPFPSEITFGFTSVLAAEGHAGLRLWLIIVVGVAGEICGSFVAYAIGRTGGRAVVDRWGKYVLLSHADLDRADAFMARRGFWAVLIGRIVPLLRAFISLAAGIGEMPLVAFGIATTIGTVVYCTALSLLGYSIGSATGNQWHKLVKSYSYASIVVGLVVVVVIVLAVLHRWRSMRADGARPAPVAADSSAGTDENKGA